LNLSFSIILFPQIGSVNSSDGSAFVKIGNTSVVGSVVAEIATSLDSSLVGEIGSYFSYFIFCVILLPCIFSFHK
jgi:hypothetical protein